ncbi:response regulator [Roseicyclus persicicus]|uniref:Response regulator n=1 Tax=Roseicyclus persicicus TaxID=2650661 RepID=A0A7X6GYD4_9RHOB|nr:response regulator [Roseibacterium persicicum]NKX43763.1 response regulator [Roseibacterium persicicum]
MKILAVDDDPDFLALFQSTLQSLGYTRVTTAVSGDDALRKIGYAQVPFDCFILDIKMPGMDGIELCRRIRALPQYRDAPIMMNTIMSDRDHIDRAFSAGATDYLTKPVDPIEIRARLGVIEQLVLERLRAQIAVTQGNGAMRAMASYGFMDGIPMKRVVGAMDRLAMANYLNALGLFRAMATSAVAVQVVNAREIYDLEGGAVFGEIMVDVATCLSDCLQGRLRMISYAGGGTFVFLANRSELEDGERLAARLSHYIEEFHLVYKDLGITLPTVAVGTPVACGASHLRAPDRIIDEAVTGVRRQGAGLTRTA